jgi:hypothetical protein
VLLAAQVDGAFMISQRQIKLLALFHLGKLVTIENAIAFKLVFKVHARLIATKFPVKPGEFFLKLSTKCDVLRALCALHLAKSKFQGGLLVLQALLEILRLGFDPFQR